MQPTTRSPLRSLALGTALAMAFLALGAATALASEAAEEQRGADLLTAVERGEMDCADLDSADFDAIGEFAMGRMLGSPQVHEAMDETMTQMMGAAGLDRMHEVMGQRFAGCGAPGAQGGYGGMMGLIQMMGGPDASGQGYGPGGGSGMMGFDRGVDDDDGPDAWMVIVMLLLIVGTGVAVFAIARRRGTGSVPLDLLAQRFARGEMTAEDYERRRALLQEGGGR